MNGIQALVADSRKTLWHIREAANYDGRFMKPAGRFWRGLTVLPLIGAPSMAPAQNAPESVSAFLAQHADTGTYAISAYVVDVYLCPPCPEHVFCKPCIPDNITLSDQPSLTQAQAHGNPTLRVFVTTSQAAQLQVGKRYDMQIQAGNSPTLVAAEPAR